MEPVQCLEDNHGRIRTSVFLCLLHQDLDVTTAWEGVKNVFITKQQILSMGTLPVRDDGSFYPFNLDPPEGLN